MYYLLLAYKRHIIHNQPVNVYDGSNTNVTTIRSVGRNTSTMIEFLHTSDNTPSI